MSATTTSPGTLNVSSGETLPIGIDFTLLMTAGQSLSLPTAALYDITTADPGTSFPAGLSGSPSAVGNVVTQTITGLAAGHTYRLVLGATAATGVIWQAGLVIVCPF